MAGLLAVTVVGVVSVMALACPFCDIESQTLTEEIQGADAAILARLVKEATTTAVTFDDFGAGGTETGNAIFEIVEVIDGPDSLAPGQQIEALYFGEVKPGQLFMVTGIDVDTIDWTTPLPLTAAAAEYIRKLSSLPESGADRLAFFQEYFEHEDPLLGQDSYDEFARASYADVQALGPRMHRQRLIDWIGNPEVSPSRRRLYMTMLGVCGSRADVPFLEELIISSYEDKKPFVEQIVSAGQALGGPIALPMWVESIKVQERSKKLGLDALIACYLVLRGPDGLDLIDRRFLSDPNTEYTHVYSTIMALRFHGEESDVVPRERLLQSVRLLLDNADFADQVITDLSRWEDWSVLERLVQLFKDSDKTAFVRQPIVTYLSVASEQEGDVGAKAAAALQELEELDPESVQRARSLMAFGYLARARAGSEESPGATRPADSGASTPGEGALASQGFGASGADTEISEDAEPADIPDPAAYDLEGNGAINALSGADTETPDDAPVPSQTEPEASRVAEAPAGGDSPDEPGDPAAAAGPTVPAATISESAASPNPLLIVGVPLVAAGLLMGLYWAILRLGAV